MLFGFALGSIDGALVAGLRLNPFIVTLATWEVFAGMTLVITGGYPIRPLGDAFQVFGKGEAWGVPVPVIIFFAAALLLIRVLTQTRFGRNVFAFWGNRDAALAGILYASRMDAGQPSVGEGWLMAAIAAAILGGTSLRGGQGSVVGTVLGALLLSVLDSGTVMMNVSGDWQRAIVGLVALVAVLVDLLRPCRA